jgi:transposase
MKIGELKALRERLVSNSLTEDDRTALTVILDSHLLLDGAVKEKSGTIRKLLKMIFGAKTEKAHVVFDMPVKPKGEWAHPRGHGRKGAAAYTGGEKVIVHTTLKSGDPCPECHKGRVYPSQPSVVVRITGDAPLTAISFECEKLRCNLCGEVFTATLPDETGSEKYDAAAGAMISLLKYGSGLPFNRLEQLQESMGIPLPASTQWNIVEKTADRIHPAYKELIRQAAQGEIIHNDDTTMKITTAINENGRSGTFTTGMLSMMGERKIALFFTGQKHAGENLTDLLAERHPDRGPPIQMADALSRNISREFATLLANCMSHARRNFVDVAESFPDECRHVIEALGEVYKTDTYAKKRDMTPDERLACHQAKSAPLMSDLQRWITTQFKDKKAEPNSGLGKAFSYMLKHWEPLTLFLRVPGAPLDNNICEQALKMAIRHRRNSLFYRTLHGAYIGDLFMSLIHTCRLSKVNPFDYLVALQKHSHEVFKNPHEWLPWNYEAAVTGLSAALKGRTY